MHRGENCRTSRGVLIEPSLPWTITKRPNWKFLEIWVLLRNRKTRDTLRSIEESQRIQRKEKSLKYQEGMKKRSSIHGSDPNSSNILSTK